MRYYIACFGWLLWIIFTSSMKRLLLVPGLTVLSSALIYSCTCSSLLSCYVLDKDDHKPIPGVYVISEAASDGRVRDKEEMYTDSTGFFKADYKVGGVAKCPVHKITLVKTGYRTVRLTDLKTGDTVLLEKGE